MENLIILAIIIKHLLKSSNMINWQILNESESKKAWDFVYTTLGFSPYSLDHQPIKTELSSICFDLEDKYGKGFSEDFYNELHKITLECFRKTGSNSKYYALNWQHNSYSFDPLLPFEKDEFGEWLIPVFPNGDFHFFITNDLKNVFFADGINFRICLFGDNIIKNFDSKTLSSFQM
jgi:Protein of unknown function (DUF2716)